MEWLGSAMWFVWSERDNQLSPLLKSILKGFSPKILASPEKTVQHLNKSGLESKIVKYPRKNKPNDSYIISLWMWKHRVSVKIHPDIFGKCRRVYENKLLLWSLVEDHDIAKIFETYTVHGFRIVLYKWEKWKNPSSVLQTLRKRTQNRIERELSRLLSSIYRKWCQLSPPEPESHEFIYTPTGRLVLLDPNRILRRETDESPVKKAQQIMKSWIEHIIHAPTQKRAVS